MSDEDEEVQEIVMEEAYLWPSPQMREKAIALAIEKIGTIMAERVEKQIQEKIQAVIDRDLSAMAVKFTELRTQTEAAMARLGVALASADQRRPETDPQLVDIESRLSRIEFSQSQGTSISTTTSIPQQVEAIARVLVAIKLRLEAFQQEASNRGMYDQQTLRTIAASHLTQVFSDLTVVDRLNQIPIKTGIYSP